jgi:hypothetical protein
MRPAHGLAVQVYRLVTCGTVEEKILRNQIFKRGLHRVVLQREHQQRYFTKQQLHALFDLGPTERSQTHEELEQLHGHQRSESTEVEVHRTQLEAHCRAWVRGISDYHLLFSHPPAPPPAAADTDGPAPGSARARAPRATPPPRARAGRPKASATKQRIDLTEAQKTAYGYANLVSDEEESNQVSDEDIPRGGDLVVDKEGAVEEDVGGDMAFRNFDPELCEDSDFRRLGAPAQGRLVLLLAAARDAEAGLLCAGGAEAKREEALAEAGMAALGSYLQAADLLLAGGGGATCGLQRKLLRLSARLGLSTRAVLDAARVGP